MVALRQRTKWSQFPLKNGKKNKLQTRSKTEDSPMTCQINWLTVLRSYQLIMYDHFFQRKSRGHVEFFPRGHVWVQWVTKKCLALPKLILSSLLKNNKLYDTFTLIEPVFYGGFFQVSHCTKFRTSTKKAILRPSSRYAFFSLPSLPLHKASVIHKICI